MVIVSYLFDSKNEHQKFQLIQPNKNFNKTIDSDEYSHVNKKPPMNNMLLFGWSLNSKPSFVT